MKIRVDFVTNSSSSSYVIAFKGLPKIDEETLRKYPFLVQYQTVVKEAIYGNDGGSYETEKAEEIHNLADLQTYYVNNYGWGGKTFKDIICFNPESKELFSLRPIQFDILYFSYE